MINNLIGQHLSEIFRGNWEKEFVIDTDRDIRYSYKRFLSDIISYMEVFNNSNIQKDDLLVVSLENSMDLFTIYFVSLAMELTVVPIDPQKGTNEIDDILSSLDYRYIICSKGMKNIIKDKIIYIDELKKQMKEKKFNNIEDIKIWSNIDYTRPYLITFTSGSTGIPKGVVHSFRNLFLSSKAFGKKFEFNSKNIFYHNLPMTYMAGILNQIFLPFIFESKIVLGSRFSITNAIKFWDMPIKYEANTFWLTPTIISLLLKLDRGNSGTEYLKENDIIACVGTAPLYSEVKEQFEEKYSCLLYESYGLSELLFVSTNQPNDKKKKDCVGELLDDVNIRLDLDNELLINVSWSFLGYTNVNTEKSYKENYYLSGDFGYIDNENNLFITGRKKDLIIRGGINISPRKIEKLLSNMSIFEDLCILGIKDFIIGEKIVLFYKLDDKNNIDKDIINKNIIAGLGMAYKVDKFVKLDELPKNLNGKIDKIKLVEIYEDRGRLK